MAPIAKIGFAVALVAVGTAAANANAGDEPRRRFV
jgi:hypothetical protein